MVNTSEMPAGVHGLLARLLHDKKAFPTQVNVDAAVISRRLPAKYAAYLEQA